MEIETEDPGNGSEVGSDYVDADGDGYLSQVDCNDQDATTHPGAGDVPEDGVGQDCDGVAATTASVDADGDGEWLELYNAAGHSVNLEGLIGSDAAFDAADST